MIVDRKGLRIHAGVQKMTLIEELSLSGDLSPRDLLCLVAVEAGFSHRRLAQAIGVHKTTVGRQIRNARKRAAALQLN